MNKRLIKNRLTAGSKISVSGDPGGTGISLATLARFEPILGAPITNKKQALKGFFFIGDPGGTRTHDTKLKRLVL